jgi:serine/threonine protein kinase
MSRPVPRTNGQLVLSDFGSARYGQETYSGDIMPAVYRAPEVILGMEWSSAVDIWSTGVMVSLGPLSSHSGVAKAAQIWDLLEGKRLFNSHKDGVLSDEQHLAEMVSLMGNPPPEFLQRSEASARFFDDAGQ